MYVIDEGGRGVEGESEENIDKIKKSGQKKKKKIRYII